MVAILEIKKVEVKILEGLYHPILRDYGQMIDDCHDFYHVFEKGKVYGIVGECGAGGWGISYNLAGRENFIKGEIKIDGQLVTLKELQQVGWCVGDGMPRSGLFSKSKSVFRQLQDGMNTSNEKKLSVNDIVNKFNLSNDRLNLKVEEYSWEKWRASIAIGYSCGKKLFCFPWLNTRFINDLILNAGIHICVDILKNDGGIVIIPTENAESVESFVDEIVYLKNGRHLPSKRARELVEEYRDSANNK